jgi:hypothetical protein
VRSDSKASSAGSTSSQGASLGSFLRGAFAIRGASGGADGSGAPAGRIANRGLLILLGLVVGAAMALTATPAMAITSHAFTGVTIGPVGTTLGVNESERNFNAVQAIAVDQATGNLFVYDAGLGKIYKYNSNGEQLAFSALGGSFISGVGGNGGGEEELAIAPPGSPGGTAGYIYVAVGFEIKVYSPAGNFVEELKDGAEYCGVATDPAGHVFVGAYPNVIREYVPGATPFADPPTAEASPSAELPEICNVAADGAGHVYGAHYYGESFVQLDGIGDETVTPIGPGSTLAIDPNNNDVYANQKNSVVQYDSSGTVIGSFAGAQITPSEMGSHGVAVNATTGKVYVGGIGTRVGVFGPETTLAGVKAEPPSGVGGTKATLNLSVNPDNVAITECILEYGPTSSYGSTKPCEGSIPTDGSDHAVATSLTNLVPGTTYHWRAVVSNANGPNETADETFVTKVPAVTGEATELKGGKATLNGIVKPEGEAVTSCVFEYGRGISYGKTVPCVGAIPTDEAEHAVTAAVSDLQLASTYHFRIVIVRGGTIPGADKTFKTQQPVETGSFAKPVTLPNEIVQGIVNPEGAPVTACGFEYGLTKALGQSTPCTESLATIGSGESPVEVHGTLENLSPGTRYLYRAFAASAEGSSTGSIESFTTPGAVIESARVITVGEGEAEIETRINPKGSATEYKIEYGTDTSYGTSTPLVFVGEDSLNHTFTDTLTGLSPGVTYHFRVVATNSVGATEEADQSFVTRKPVPVKSDCANQSFRNGSGANLPDCRAYEQASPIEKHGGFIRRASIVTQASASGNRITFAHVAGLETEGGSAGPPTYLATRGPDGWSTAGTAPLVEPGRGFETEGWGPEISKVFSKVTNKDGSEFVLYDSATNSFSSAYRWETKRFFPKIAEFAADPLHFMFEAGSNFGEAPLAPGGIPNTNNVYDFNHGVVTAVARIPAGSATSCDDSSAPACIPAPAGSFSGPYDWHSARTDVDGGAFGGYYLENATSDDGSRQFFTTAGAGQLYMREDGTKTIRISASQASTPDPNGTKPAAFLRAAPDGSKVFFLSCEKLTDDSTAVSTPASSCDTTPQGGGVVGQDLYLYDVDSGDLTDLTVDNDRERDPRGAAVFGFLGGSDDGAYAYFMAEGALAPGASSTTNLYVIHNGAISLVTSGLSRSDDEEIWYSNFVQGPALTRKSIVSPNGTLMFPSIEKLTDFDNSAAGCGGSRCTEIYRYVPTSKDLSCVSCDPSRAAPAGSATMGAPNNAVTLNIRQLFRTHNLSSDGNRVFFQSPDPLVAADTNGHVDPYEWEAAGTGSCEAAEAVADGGCLYLLSTGTSPEDSYLADVSASGDDAFIYSSQQLVPSDKDELNDVYDVRAGGGLASQHPENAAPPCLGEACKGPSTEPGSESSPGTATFSGPGNQKEKPAKKRCKKTKGKKCKQSKKHKSKKSRGAHNNRGGSK